VSGKRRYSSEADPTKDRIVAAALECVGHTSIKELSVRTIAATAGVNVATVHYYFRTKDAVVSAALGEFFRRIAGSFERAVESDATPREKLVEFLVAYSALFHAHPGLFASMMEAIFSARLRRAAGAAGVIAAPGPGPASTSGQAAYEDMLVALVSRMKPRALDLVRQLAGDLPEEELVMRMIRTMTSVLHPILLSDFSSQVFGLDLGEEEVRRRYVEQVVASL
jgi:AcrR family transcriptional regulator